MTSRISHTTLDCTGAHALSEWWKGVIGYTDVPGDPNLPGHEECMLVDPTGGHGATLHDDLRGKYGPGTGWVTLADPEGNLFCVLRSDAELAQD